MLTSISGDVGPQLDEVEDDQRTRPATMHSQVPGLLQPQMLDCWKPNTLRATPAAISTARGSPSGPAGAR